MTSPEKKIVQDNFYYLHSCSYQFQFSPKKLKSFGSILTKLFFIKSCMNTFATDCVHIFRSISITDIIMMILNVLYNAYDICIRVLYGFVSRCTRMYQWIKKYTVLFKRLSRWSHSDFPPSISISSMIYQTFDLNGENLTHLKGRIVEH